MSDLREKVARAIDPAIWSWEPDASNAAQIEGHAARRRLSLADADAAIAAVLEAMPTGDMLQAGNRVWLDGGNERQIFDAMLTAFTRDHYLSALAEEDGKEL